MEYFCKYLSIYYLGGANPSHGDKNLGEDVFAYIDSIAPMLGGVTLPMALAELGLINEYELVVHPRLVGHGPTLLAGLSEHLDLKLVNRLEFASGRSRCDMERRG